MADPLIGRSAGLFLYLLVLDGAAIFFFTRGFLLTRTELPLFSHCSDISRRPSKFRYSCPNVNVDHNLVDSSGNSSNADDTHLIGGHSDDGECKEKKASGSDEEEQCWTRPAVKKAIILIIDALRFDFVAHSRNFGGERKPWMDNLHVLQRLVEDQSCGAARIFKFVADPPSTTLQRLKGLTTGGLPTFIDIGHSFGAPAIVEDNLILQLVQTGKKVIVMGDDTWTQLFPTQFTEAYPFPSFNVKDLHTVDDGVIKELFPALHRDWDVLIGHFLGVDHVGHIFGVESSLMPEKLEQYNKVIENVVQLLRNRSGPGELFEDTVLLVLGDHGQTLNGDHGGGTPDEVESALFVMRTNSNSGPSSSSLLPSPSWLPSSCDLEDPVSGCINVFPQLDFSATLAAVLGVPFPFGSVGKVNPDVFTLLASEASSEKEEDVQHSGLKLLERYRDVLRINSWQVRRYFGAYAQSAISGFQPQDLAQLEDLYAKAQNLSDQNVELGSSSRCTEDHHARAAEIARDTKVMREQVNAHRNYLSAAASLARTQWTQFGLQWMIFGLSLLVACIVVRVLALYRLCDEGWKGSKTLLPSQLMLIVTLSCLYVTGLVVLLYPLLAKTFFHTILNYGTENPGSLFLGVLMISSVVAYFSASPQSLPDKETHPPTPAAGLEKCQNDREVTRGPPPCQSVRTVASSLFMTLHAGSLFSNSYIVAEGQVIQFLIASVGLVYLRLAIRANCKARQALCFLAINLVMSKIHTLPILKRVIPGESQSQVVLDNGVMSSLLPSIMMTCMTIIGPLVVISWLLNREYKKQHLWGFITLGTIITYASIGLHWLIADLKSGDILNIFPGDLAEISRLQLPRIVYAVTILLIVSTVILGPFCSKALVTSSSVDYVKVATRVCTALVAGSSGTIIMLLGRKGPLLALLAVLEINVFLDLQGLTHPPRQEEKELFLDNKEKNVGEPQILSSFAPTAEWSLIAAHVFFCTGHSCAFDGLHYSAAFIGFDDFGFYQQGMLLATETFGPSHVSPIFALPLLVRQVFISRSFAAAGGQEGFRKFSVVREVTEGYLWVGLFRACVTCVTSASVFIQRRHLMVWGIFAPKYVFDAVGFLVVDAVVLLVVSVYLLYE